MAKPVMMGIRIMETDVVRIVCMKALAKSLPFVATDVWNQEKYVKISMEYGTRAVIEPPVCIQESLRCVVIQKISTVVEMVGPMKRAKIVIMGMV
jgi:hypothetical protein